MQWQKNYICFRGQTCAINLCEYCKKVAFMMASNSTIGNEIICRTCMGKEGLFSIFEITHDTMTLDLLISSVTGVQIEQGDGLPSTICLNCKEKAITAFDFKRKSQNVDSTLRDLFKKEEIDTNLDEQYDNCDDIKTELHLVDNPDECLDEWAAIDAIVKNENVPHDNSHYECKNCTAVFESFKKYQQHLRKKCVKVEIDDSSNNYCPLCGIYYYDAVSLTKHMWESHTDLMGPKKRGRPRKLMTGAIISKLTENGFHLKSEETKKYSCTFCDEEFKTKEDIHTHQKEHTDKLSFCLFCKKTYLDKNYFDSHVCIINRNSQKGDQDPDEEKSKQDFMSEITFQELLGPYDSEENDCILTVCPVCTGVFRSEDALAVHTDTEHPELSLRCNLCSKMFATVKSASRHRNICKQIERKFRCSTCGLKFAYELSLNKHILRYHEGESVSVTFIDGKSKETRKYQCDDCDKFFDRKQALVRHSKIHSDKLHECEVCKKKFNRSDNLRSHKRIHEPRDKSKVTTCLCLYCGRSFNNSSNLIVHMRRHTGEKPYKCDFCGKGFPRSSDLQCHRRSHTGEKPCICGVCGKGFSRSNKLSRHMRVHTGVKPYKCTYCGKAFSQSNDLTLHVRRHTGDKPYICEVCGDRFIQGTALHNHRRTHGHFPESASVTQLPSITYTVQRLNTQE
ncbi:zinc finger protein 271 [Amyelois transitella]|uniref:zinc finger protein 271 n=1 Tax=Amyelois transitella TaxID=680683 RepID=UPI00067D51DE|nr:zinc finger protein 271 [Amyelois transitella]